MRLITATNRDLKGMVRSGGFRKDLYYRLNVFAVRIPPLRERPDDILELAHHFLGELNRTLGTEVDGFDPVAADMLTAYSWPGNARELRNVVERALILARSGQIGPHHLPSDLHRPAIGTNGAALRPLAEIEAEHITRVLGATRGNIKRAAEILSISRTTLYNKLKAHQIEVPG